jgi:peptide/nickel transport system substrate-binding protein
VTHRGRRPGWRRRLTGLSLVVVFVAAGCGYPGTTSTTDTYVAVKGGSISFGMSQSPTGCNPHTPAGDTPGTRLLLGAVLPSPFFVSSTGAPAPNPNLIIQSELVSTKPETIVYTLNPKAVWSDGVPITASDFEYAWTQQRVDASTGAPTVSSIAGYKDISSVTGSNGGRTVTVVFHTTYADWQMLFDNLLPAHIMEKAGWNPTCSTVNPAVDLSGGPFEITSVSAQTVTLGDNPKWWGTPPNASTITVHIASSSAQLAQWMSSDFVQVALPSTITQSFLNEMTSLPDAQSEVDTSATLLQLEMASGPASPISPDVREAIALSINRQSLVNLEADWALPSIQVANSHILVQGQTGYHLSPAPATTVTTGTTPSTTSTTIIGQGGTVNFPTTPVPGQADALMNAAGYFRSDGIPWHSAFLAPYSLHIVVDGGDPWAVTTAQIIRDQLEDAGFTTSLYTVASAATAGSVLADGFADMALIPRTSTPYLSQTLAWYTSVLGPAGENGSENWSNYDNSQFDQLVQSASQQLNPDTATATYAQADTDLWDDMVGLPLFVEPSTLIWSRTIGGVVPTPRSDSLLWYAQFWAVRHSEPTNNTTPSLPGQ